MTKKNRFQQVGKFLDLPIFCGHMKMNRPQHDLDYVSMQHVNKEPSTYWHEISLYVNGVTLVSIYAYGKVDIDGETKIVNLYANGTPNQNKFEEAYYREVVWDIFRMQNKSEEQLINMIRLHDGNADLALKFLCEARIVYSKEASKMGIDDPVLVGYEQN